jgi:putative peptidoglycan lipid II flippase
MRSYLLAFSKVSSSILLSRVLGLARDILFARWIPSVALDLFIVAFQIPNFFRRIVAEGAFTQCFLPIYATYQEQPKAARHRFIVSIFYSMLGLLILLVFGLMVSTHWWVPRYLSGITDPARLSLAQQLIGLTIPYLLGVTGMAFFSALLNAHRRFGWPALAPCFLNIVLIVALGLAVYQSAEPLVIWLGYAVPIAGVIQCLWVWVAWRTLDGPMHWWVKIDWQGVSRLMKKLFIGLSAGVILQCGLLIDVYLASFLISGSMTWLYYGQRLMQLPFALIGIGWVTVWVPSLNQAYHEKRFKDYSKLMHQGINVLLVIGLPAAMGLIFLAKPIIATLFYHGSFLSSDVERTASSLQGYACGLPAYVLIRWLSSLFYARQDMASPVRYITYAMVVHVVLCVIFMPKYGHIAIAYSLSFSAWFQIGCLLVGLRKAGFSVEWSSVLWGRMLLLIIIFSIWLWYMQAAYDFLQFVPSMRIFWLTLYVGLSVGFYALCAWPLGLYTRLSDADKV